MANFSTPFASTGPRRNPTVDERANGFPCGPADQTLFNGLFHRIESELGNVITYAGLTPTDTDFSQLRQAIIAIIDAATGGGETEGYLLLDQARSRLPIYPQIESADNRINVISPAAGSVRVPGGVTFLHRGIFPVVTAQADFPTGASKTYHVRWNPTDGLSLKDLASGAYNPNGWVEADRRFDSTYDDMLIARVVTNSGNIPTITLLANAVNLRLSQTQTGPANKLGSGDQTIYPAVFNYNWGRTPDAFFEGSNAVPANQGFRLEGYVNEVRNRAVTRYAASADVAADFTEVIAGTPQGSLSLLAIA